MIWALVSADTRPLAAGSSSVTQPSHVRRLLIRKTQNNV
jgi:hypothetical protein